MGGYFSTRWGSEHTRQDTGSLLFLFLDATKLRKMGALEPEAIAWHEWTNGRGDVVGGIQTYRHATDDALTLSYSIRENGGDWQPIRERIGLEGTRGRPVITGASGFGLPALTATPGDACSTATPGAFAAGSVTTWLIPRHARIHTTAQYGAQRGCKSA